MTERILEYRNRWFMTVLGLVVATVALYFFWGQIQDYRLEGKWIGVTLNVFMALLMLGCLAHLTFGLIKNPPTLSLTNDHLIIHGFLGKPDRIVWADVTEARITGRFYARYIEIRARHLFYENTLGTRFVRNVVRRKDKELGHLFRLRWDSIDAPLTEVLEQIHRRMGGSKRFQ